MSFDSKQIHETQNTRGAWFIFPLTCFSSLEVNLTFLLERTGNFETVSEQLVSMLVKRNPLFLYIPFALEK